MRYLVAWLLGVPFSLVALWYVVGHMACSIRLSYRALPGPTCLGAIA